MNESIRYNLDFGNTGQRGVFDYDDDFNKNISHYINVLGLHDFVSKNGLDYAISENNSNTSGGEKQKIAILRVLCKDKMVMTFDEPSSASDTRSIREFFSYLQRIKREKVIIVITHDEIAKRWCDVVIEIA